jgi:hypothetical protein
MFNSDNSRHVLSVRIERDGERLLAETHQLGSDGSPDRERTASIPCGLGSERGRYTLSFETGTGRRATLEPDRADAPAFSVVVSIGADGALGTSGRSYPYGKMCGDPTPTPE